MLYKMKIYTKTGDEGKTQYYKERIYKNDPRIHIVGILDELNASMSHLYPSLNDIDSEFEKGYFRQDWKKIQCQLIDLGSYFSGYSEKYPEPSELEELIDHYDEYLEPLKHFLILVPKVRLESDIHVCRGITRKLERYIVEELERFNKALPYVNRLSDYFFVLARYISKITQTKEIPVHSVNGRHEPIDIV